MEYSGERVHAPQRDVGGLPRRDRVHDRGRVRDLRSEARRAHGRTPALTSHVQALVVSDRVRRREFEALCEARGVYELIGRCNDDGTVSWMLEPGDTLDAYHCRLMAVMEEFGAFDHPDTEDDAP
jgi:hypothetical protein